MEPFQTDEQGIGAANGDAGRQLLNRARELQRNSLTLQIELQKQVGETIAAKAGEAAARAELETIVNSRGFKWLMRLRAVQRLWKRGRRRHFEESAVSSSTPATDQDALFDTLDTAVADQAAVDMIYSPLAWPLDHENDGPSADAKFINLIILSATQRAGSTLLQRICNTRRGTLIWGEHGGMLAHFCDIYWCAAYFSSVGGLERDAYFQQGENPNVWIASMSPELSYARRAIIHSARALLNTYYSQYREGRDILGFKEVAYGRSELELLRRCYPEAHILCLVRHPFHTWRSTPRSWCPSLDRWTTKWNEVVKCFRDFTESDGRSHLIRYEDLIRQEAGVMDSLAKAAKVTPEQVASVLAHKIGSNNAELGEADRMAILSHCSEQMNALGYLQEGA